MVVGPLPLALPPANAFALCVTGMQCFNLLAGANEIKTPTQYSKFAPELPPMAVSSKTGMLMIYGPALAVGAAALINPASVNGREALTAGLITVHFLKRCLEVLFVHEYSGSVSAAVSGGIGIFYGLVSFLIVSMQGTVEPAIYQAGLSNMLRRSAALKPSLSASTTFEFRRAR